MSEERKRAIKDLYEWLDNHAWHHEPGLIDVRIKRKELNLMKNGEMPKDREQMMW